MKWVNFPLKNSKILVCFWYRNILLSDFNLIALAILMPLAMFAQEGLKFSKFPLKNSKILVCFWYRIRLLIWFGSTVLAVPMPLLVASDLKFSDLLRVSSKHLSRKLIAFNACFVLFCPAVRSCSTSLSLVTVIHREGVGVKRKQKQRKTKKLGWLCGAGPDSGKKKIACFVLRAKGPPAGGNSSWGSSSLSLSLSVWVLACVSFTTSHVPSHALPAFGG